MVDGLSCSSGLKLNTKQDQEKQTRHVYLTFSPLLCKCIREPPLPLLSWKPAGEWRQTVDWIARFKKNDTKKVACIPVKSGLFVCTDTSEKGAERQAFFSSFCSTFSLHNVSKFIFNEHKGISALIYPAVNCFTDRCESTVAFSHCGAAADEPDDEKEGSNCNNGHCWDEGVHVLKEVFVVVVCNEDIGSNVTQDTSSGLWVESSGNTHTPWFHYLNLEIW